MLKSKAAANKLKQKQQQRRKKRADGGDDDFDDEDPLNEDEQDDEDYGFDQEDGVKTVVRRAKSMGRQPEPAPVSAPAKKAVSRAPAKPKPAPVVLRGKGKKPGAAVPPAKIPAPPTRAQTQFDKRKGSIADDDKGPVSQQPQRGMDRRASLQQQQQGPETWQQAPHEHDPNYQPGSVTDLAHQREGMPYGQGEQTPRMPGAHRPSLDIEREIVEDPRFARIPSLQLAASQMGMMAPYMMPNGMQAPNMGLVKAPDGTMQLYPQGFGMGQPSFTMGPNGVPIMTFPPPPNAAMGGDNSFLRLPAPIGGIVDANGMLVNPPTLPYGPATVLYTPTDPRQAAAMAAAQAGQQHGANPLANENKNAGVNSTSPSPEAEKLKALSERESGCTRACRSCGFSKDASQRNADGSKQEESSCVIS